MADCYLTDRQKDLLRSLVPGLQDGTVASEWLCGHELLSSGPMRPFVFEGIPDELKEAFWDEINQSDFDNFEDCGFIRRREGGRYTIYPQKIISAVENNFRESIPQQQNQIADGTMNIKPTFGLPSQSAQFDCDVFMIMPFADEFQPIYDEHIRRLLGSRGLMVKRGDDFFSDRAIMHDIWSATNQCTFVIADCTGKNPNVFYELGIAHTLGKPAIMITQYLEDIPFDLRHLRFIVYENTKQGIQVFERKLIAAVSNLLDDLSE